MSSYFVEYYKNLFVVLLFPLQTYTILTNDAFLFSRKCVVKGPIIYFIEDRIMSRHFGGFVFGIVICSNGKFPGKGRENFLFFTLLKLNWYTYFLLEQFLQGNIPLGHLLNKGTLFMFWRLKNCQRKYNFFNALGELFYDFFRGSKNVTEPHSYSTRDIYLKIWIIVAKTRTNSRLYFELLKK